MFELGDCRRLAMIRIVPDYPPLADIVYCCETKPASSNLNSVYKAFDTILQRAVAVKVAHRKNEAADEAVTLAQFNHPNIVIIHRTGLTKDGRRYLITEWLDGGSLEDRLNCKQTPESPQQWAALFEKLALALDATHNLGLQHRDIKPGNILFAHDGTPKLADFGLAVSATSPLDGSGTPGYRAKEHVAGKPSRFSDVYSFGVTMWRCLTKQQPIHEPLVCPASLPGVNSTLLAIVRTCLDDEPTDEKPMNRFGLRDFAIEDQFPAKALAEDLRHFLNYEPTRSRPLNAAQRAMLWLRREPWQAAAMAAMLLGMTVSAGLALWLWVTNGDLQNSIVRERAASREADDANLKRIAEVSAKLRAEHRSRLQHYAQQLKKVQENLRLGDSAAAVAELGRCDETLRGWEWNHLRGQCSSALREVKFSLPVQGLAAGRENRLAVAVWGGSIYNGPWDDKLPQSRPLREPIQRDPRQLYFHDNYLFTASVARSPGTKFVATVIDRHPRLNEQPPIRELIAGEPGSQAAFSGELAVFTGEGETLKSLDLKTGVVRVDAKDMPVLTALALRPDHAVLAAIVEGKVRTWDWPSMKSLPSPAQIGMIRTLAFNAKGELALVVGRENSSIHFWKFENGWKTAPGVAPSGADIRAIHFSSAQEEAFVSVGRDLIVWTFERGNWQARHLFGGIAPINSIAFSENGSTIFSGDAEGVVREFNTRKRSGIEMKFVHEVKSKDGIVCRIVAGKIQCYGRTLDLANELPKGLAIDERNGMTRLLVKTDQRRVVVVDVPTNELVVTELIQD